MEAGRGWVRLATAADLASVVELIASCPDAPRWPAGAWQSFVSGQAEHAGRRALFVMEAEAAMLAGLIAVTLIGQTTELELLLIHPRVRRKGFGRRLSERWLAWANEAAAREALLEARESNRAARSLYEQLGFVVQGRRRGYYHDPVEDAILMRLELPKPRSGRPEEGGPRASEKV